MNVPHVKEATDAPIRGETAEPRAAGAGETVATESPSRGQDVPASDPALAPPPAIPPVPAGRAPIFAALYRGEHHIPGELRHEGGGSWSVAHCGSLASFDGEAVSDPASYRALALVPREESALPRRVTSTEGCPACNHSFEVKLHGYTTSVHLGERFCRGGRYGFLWLRSCRVQGPHMHQRCDACGAAWVTACARDARYE